MLTLHLKMNKNSNVSSLHLTHVALLKKYNIGTRVL